MKFRKKPIVINAERIVQFKDLPFSDMALYLVNDHGIHVWDTLHTTWVHCNFGDWIIHGVMGEFYPCVNEVFQMTYEPVDVAEIREIEGLHTQLKAADELADKLRIELAVCGRELVSCKRELAQLKFRERK